MQTIIIKLNPSKLENPDLDLRYSVPERIVEISGGAISDDGYDYLEDNSLGLWLKADCANDSYPLIVELLSNEKFLNNDLSLSAEIYISEKECDDIENCSKVFPR
ncbi:MAG: hypothetical protein Q4E74_00285 [Ruminococcus sp.]|nr:hypothetical protein [Ruminococcus sp.]